MTFYMNVGEENENMDAMAVAQEPVVDPSVLLVPEYKYLVNYDFHNFNKINFESDVADLNKNNFEYWYDNTFKDWMYNLDEQYLDVDFENVNFQFTSQAEKRLFLNKLVDFVMFTLPYQIMKKVFKELIIDDIYDAQEYLKNEDNLVELRELILINIEHNMGQLDDLIKTLRHVERIAKKNLVEENIALLDDHINENNFFLEQFKRIIQETDMFKTRELILEMLKNDSKNIL